MKKTFSTILLLLLAAFSFTLFSQVRIGVRGGVNVTGISFDKGEFSDKCVTGYHIGPAVNLSFSDNFSVETALLYSQKGIKFKDDEGTASNKNGYVDVPLDLKFAVGVSDIIKPFLKTGPYLSFRVSGDEDFNAKTEGIQSQWKSKTFGAGWSFGAGVELLGFLHTAVVYDLGLTDNYKESDGRFKVKSRTWSLSATLFF